MKFKFIISLFLLWRVGLSLAAFAGSRLMPLRQGFLGESVWANFDGVHYLTIAKHGYFQFQQAFFPFYPYLIRWLTVFTKNYLFSGLFISHFSFLIALFLFYQLVRLDFTEIVAKRSLIYLLLFPTSFYFASVYTESLFLVLVLGSFYAVRKKQWGIAGILGAFASATRFVGIFLLPALLLELWQQKRHKKNLSFIIYHLSLLLIPLGLLFYMRYLNKTTGDPLYFIHVQPFFGAQRTGGKIILLYQVFWRYLKMLVTVEKMTPTYFVVVLEFLTGIGFLASLLFAYQKKLRPSYLIFAALAYIIPTLTGTFSSLPRYVLACFPCFIGLALIKNRALRFKLCALSFSLLIVCVILFTRGYWLS